MVHLNLFLYELSTQTLCPFTFVVFGLLLPICKLLLHIIGNNTLTVIYAANIFKHWLCILPPLFSYSVFYKWWFTLPRVYMTEDEGLRFYLPGREPVLPISFRNKPSFSLWILTYDVFFPSLFSSLVSVLVLPYFIMADCFYYLLCLVFPHSFSFLNFISYAK
jgi:hypothetical protein